MNLTEEKLTQIIAVLLQKLGGEATISQREFDMMEGFPIMGSHPTPDKLKLRLQEECCEYDVMVIEED